MMIGDRKSWYTVALIQFVNADHSSLELLNKLKPFMFILIANYTETKV